MEQSEYLFTRMTTWKAKFASTAMLLSRWKSKPHAEQSCASDGRKKQLCVVPAVGVNSGRSGDASLSAGRV